MNRSVTVTGLVVSAGSQMERILVSIHAESTLWYESKLIKQSETEFCLVATGA